MTIAWQTEDGSTETVDYYIADRNWSHALPVPTYTPARCTTKYLARTIFRYIDGTTSNQKLDGRLSLEENLVITLDEQDLAVLRDENEAPNYQYQDEQFDPEFRATCTFYDGSTGGPSYRIFLNVKNPCRSPTKVGVRSTPDRLPPQSTTIAIGVETEIQFNHFYVEGGPLSDIYADICGSITYEIL